MKKSGTVNARIIKSEGSVRKAELSTAVNSEYDDGSGFITPRVELNGLKTLVNNSSILPQCIRAYKNNIAGFGIGVRYKTDEKENAEMRAEWDKITEILECLNMDQDTKEVFEDVIEARETYGIAYLEVIRNLSNEVIGVEFIRNTPSVTKTAPLLPYIDVEFEANGKTQTRKKKFCKYRQQLNGKTVYFKEMGDPRIMDLYTGEYASDKNSVPIERQANELLEFAIGTDTYGEVRWIGTALNVDGSRKAENLNNRYFAEGRHTPLMILINGGTLTDESFTKLQTYMNDIKGENGQHGFIVLESENIENRTDMEGDVKPNLEIVKMADILQKDELFQDYLNNNRRKVQSAFQLPDLYVGYTTDFNRATAQSAQEVTEKQVFQPERQSLAWIINNKLLADYHFKYVEAYFLTPDITNPDDMTKILNITERAGGLTPNKAKALTAKIFNEPAEDFDGDWGNVPLAYSKTVQPSGGGFDGENSQQVRKSAEHDDIELMSVMKEIRQILIKNSKNGEKLFTFSENRDIIKTGVIKKYDPDQPRDENGRWTSGGSGVGGFNTATSSTGVVFTRPAPERFMTMLTEAKASQPDDVGWRVDDYSHTAEEYKNDTLFATEGGSVVAVTPDGDIISVCKNSLDSSTCGGELLRMAVENGGTKLDAFSGLYGFYRKCGFEPVSWCEFSKEYAPPGWKSGRDEEEPVIFWKYTGNRASGSKESLKAEMKSFLSTTNGYSGETGYDDAMRDRDSTL